jgi:hypothetical protein
MCIHAEISSILRGQLSRYSDGLRAGRPGFDSRQGHVYPLLRSVQPDSGAHPASYPVGAGDSFPRIKRPRRESDHPPLSSAEVKNDGAIAPFPHMPSWHSA